MVEELGQLDSEPITVAIVDDHDAIRLGFKVACADAGYELLASEPTVDAALAVIQASQKTCSVAVLDLSLADASLVADNVEKFVNRGIPVLIFSIADKQALLRAALKAGAEAVVTKAESMGDLMRYIRMVAQGITVNNTQTTAAIDADLEFKTANLSPREREVLSLYASGLSLKQVAHQMNIAVGTAKDYIDRVRDKFAAIDKPAGNKTELVLRALEQGLLPERLGISEDLL